MKKILVACAVGVNTSEIIAAKIKDALSDEYDFEIETAKINDVAGMQDDFDLIVSLANIENVQTPLINGVNLLTGINAEKVIDNIKDYL